MTVIAIVFSFITIAIDETLIKSGWIESVNWFYSNKPEGARSVLSTVAGSMITVAGVVFSITIVVLSLTSSQFGPRLLHNFMRDTVSQIVLGTFIATFIYCLLILRTIRSGEETEFVPQISVIVGVLLSVASIGVLIYFIHHISQSIQAANIIAGVGHDLEKGIKELYPEMVGREEPGQKPWWRNQGDVPSNFEEEAHPVTAAGSGYVLAIDNEGLMKIAVEEKVIFHLKHNPGDFIVQGSNLVMVWPSERADENLAKKVNNTFILGKQRTHTQDVKFAIDQLVEIAVRALSPGINDPFTAMMCIDKLGVALCHLAERAIPSPYRYNDDGKLCIITKSVKFVDVVDTAFNQIRQYGRTSAAVTIRLLETIAVIAERVHRDEDRAALLRHAAMIERGSREGLSEELDRRDVKERYEAVVQTLVKKKTFN